MDDTGPLNYQATHRRSETAIPALFGVLALLAAGIAATILYVDGRHLETALFSVFGLVVLSLLAILVTAFRVHRWTITPEGIDIHERPKVPLTGFARRAVVRFPAIAALRQVESGFVQLIEIVTQDGRRFRLPQEIVATPRGAAHPAPAANIDAFAASIRAAAQRAGHALPSTSQGLSFWNTVAGLVLLSIVLVLTLVLAGAVAWAVWDGMTTRGPRGGEMITILLLLSVGAGYLLLKSARRRRAVLASLAAHRDQ